MSKYTIKNNNKNNIKSKNYTTRYNEDLPKERFKKDFNNPKPAKRIIEKEVVQISEPMRINKFLARAGVASRRKAEELILDGRIQINGKTITELSVIVSENDVVSLDNNPINIHKSEIYLYHKPKGLVTTHKDEQDRDTVFENLPKHLPRLVSVGRLDINSEGLLILTNDSKIANYFENPKNSIERTYKVRVFGRFDESKLAHIAHNGLKYEDVFYQPFSYEIINKTDNNCWILITIKEGKNRELRNIMTFLGLKVSRLIRISYGDFSLGNLLAGKVIKLSNEITEKILKDINENNNR
jgi:23S rRNA pseudouridine2605 synthase